MLVRLEEMLEEVEMLLTAEEVEGAIFVCVTDVMFLMRSLGVRVYLENCCIWFCLCLIMMSVTVEWRCGNWILL